MRRIVERTTFRFEDTKIPITISIGVTTANANTGGPTEFIKESDENLYEAKRRGRNCVVAA